MILLIGILWSMTPFIIFSLYNKEAIKEYIQISNENRINGIKNIDVSKLIYTRLEYDGMIATDDKLNIICRVIHPYDIFIEDKKKYGSKISTWSQNVESYRSHENSPPPLTYGLTLSKDEKGYEDHNYTQESFPTIIF